MKLNTLTSCILVALCSITLTAARGGPASDAVVSTNNTGPRIRFDSEIYNFETVNAGEMVRHSFVFTNTGGALLVVSNVQPSCGCTTAGAWTKEVEPGKTGTIPVQFNSSSYSGPVTKSVTVTCNVKARPIVGLQIKGKVWKAIDVIPQNAVLNVLPESSSNTTLTLRILNNTDQPITLEEPKSDKPVFAAELKTVRPGKEFQLIVSTVPPVGPGNVQGMITLKTSSTNMPVIKVVALAILQPAVAVVPPQIFLSAGPLPRPLTTIISVRNNGKNPITLSDAAVNAQGVEVHVKENQPGKQFALTLNFPAGFETSNGATALTFKSSNPQFKEIKVPIVQPGRPANIATTALPGRRTQTNRPSATKAGTVN